MCLNIAGLFCVKFTYFFFWGGFLSISVQPGENEIRRRSEESSVTIPYDRSFRRIGSGDQPRGSDALSKFQFW